MRKPIVVPGLIAAALTLSLLAVPLPAGGAEELVPPTNPTVLTAEQLQRDRGRVPLAESIVDAYPNWNGFFSSLVAN